MQYYALIFILFVTTKIIIIISKFDHKVGHKNSAHIGKNNKEKIHLSNKGARDS